MATPKEYINTSVVSLIYNHFQKPDTTYNPDGEYSVTFRTDDKEFLKALKERVDAAKRAVENQGKSVKVQYPFKKDEKNEGFFIVKAKVNKVGSSNGNTWENIVKIVDIKGNPLDLDGKFAATDSKIRVNIELSDYNIKGSVGTTLRLKAVQIVELIEYVKKDKAVASNPFGDNTNDANKTQATPEEEDFGF